MPGVERERGVASRPCASAAVVAFLDRSADANEALSQLLDALDTKSLSTSIVHKAGPGTLSAFPLNRTAALSLLAVMVDHRSTWD